MRKLYTIEIILLTYLVLCIIGFAGGTSNFWKSFYFIREHGFIIALLIGPKNYFSTVFKTLLSWGVVTFKLELIAFNVVLIFLTKEHYDIYNHCYILIVIFSFTIWFTIFICTFFDKIVIIINKCLKIFQT